jgi:MOSC domain-containing protein YiiM
VLARKRRTGFYVTVATEGPVAAGDAGTEGTARSAITILTRDPAAVSVADITRVYAFDKDDRGRMRRIIAASALAEGW